MRVTWFTAASLDGRIAGPGDDMSLLDAIDGGDDESGDFTNFMSTVDAILVGGSTLRWLHGQGHDVPHRGLPIWLLSHDERLAERAAAADPSGTPVTRREGAVEVVLDEIAAAGHRHLWIGGGGDVAGQALAADRVDDVVVTMAPVALGAGPSIFDTAGIAPRSFTLAACRRYGRDSVRLHWQRALR
jgi:riboflavin biosynthesis pyrimidine reductase